MPAHQHKRCPRPQHRTTRHEASHSMTCISKMTNHTHRTNIGHLMQLLYCFSVALTETSDHICIAYSFVEAHFLLDLLFIRASSILGTSIFRPSSSYICFSVASIFIYFHFLTTAVINKCKSVFSMFLHISRGIK